MPAAQKSPPVQTLPSVQPAVLFALVQPLAGKHESSVHALASLQLMAAPGTHWPAAQTSAPPVPVQALLSVQVAVLFAW